MKTLKNVVFESLECVETSELREVLEFIDALLALYKLGGKIKPLTRGRMVSIATAAIEAGADPKSPYITEEIVKELKGDLDCFVSCQWDSFVEDEQPTEEELDEAA